MVKLFYTILPIFDTWKKSRFPKVVNMENSLFYCPDLHKKAKNVLSSNKYAISCIVHFYFKTSILLVDPAKEEI